MNVNLKHKISLQEGVFMKFTIKDMILCALFASITAVLAQIAIPIPFTTVPLTLQVFAVALSGIVLGGKRAFVSQVIYVLLGAIGLPVFAQLSGGLHIIVGYTGGFILSFPFVAALIGYVSYKNDRVLNMALGIMIAMAVNYFVGTLQYSLLANVSFVEGLMVCVVPFIAIDIIKYFGAFVIGQTVKKRLNLKVNAC